MHLGNNGKYIKKRDNILIEKTIQLLDCTLRDGAYIVDGYFDTPAIKGIIHKLQDANVDIIECGWLKDPKHQKGTTYFQLPSDLKPYLGEKKKNTTYVAMIDWNRYDLEQLPPCDKKTIDAIRVVFPYEHFREGIEVGKKIKEKGYAVYYQAANTLAYSDEDLCVLAEEINKASPVCLSIVDTFGAMYEDDLERIATILNEKLNNNIKIGFHSHNNQQLSYSLSMYFVKLMYEWNRSCIIDASLCGMGRGAGNTTTELIANFLNRKYKCNYDMNMIMDAIDMYMQYFQQKYTWGYSTPYFIAGMYCAHVNNIAYLLENHRCNAKDMRNVIETLSADERKKYDYDLLEKTYLDYQNKIVDDEYELERLHSEFSGKNILLLLPGKTLYTQREKIEEYIKKNEPVVIGINAIIEGYKYDYLFFSNSVRYSYAKEIYTDEFEKYKRIVSSNIKINPDTMETIVNFNLLVKRGWDHFDNSGIMCLRLLNRICASDVAIAGFDGFSTSYDDNYADVSLPHINPGKKWDELNEEIQDMLNDFVASVKNSMTIKFITDSKYTLY